MLVYGAGFAVVFITNIGPLLAKPETYGVAFMNAVLLVFMTNIFSEAGVLKDPRKKRARCSSAACSSSAVIITASMASRRERIRPRVRMLQGSRQSAIGKPRFKHGEGSIRKSQNIPR